MYGHGGSSDAIAKNMNSLLHSSTFKHPSDGEFAKIKELISSNSYSNYNHHEHNNHSSSQNQNQNQNQMQNQNQHRPNIGGQTKASLTSYRSAPSSFFANLLDENDFFSPLDTTNNEPDDAFFSRQPQQQQQTFQPSSKSMKLEAEKEGIRVSSDMYGGSTQQVSHMQPTNNNGNYNHNGNMDSSSTFRSMNSNNNLIRQSSSPAGFLSALNSENRKFLNYFIKNICLFQLACFQYHLSFYKRYRVVLIIIKTIIMYICLFIATCRP